jgi:hypothetical protein
MVISTNFQYLKIKTLESVEKYSPVASSNANAMPMLMRNAVAENVGRGASACSLLRLLL